MLKYQDEWTLSRMAHLYLLMVVWVVLQVLWPANPSASWWELWAVEAICITPVIACLFFAAGVLSMLEMCLQILWSTSLLRNLMPSSYLWRKRHNVPPFVHEVSLRNTSTHEKNIYKILFLKLRKVKKQLDSLRSKWANRGSGKLTSFFIWIYSYITKDLEGIVCCV
jgi:hypothetical protein